MLDLSQFDGRWKGILSHFGLGDYLSGRHGPCPLCGGRDRFRFDDKGGRGTWFCNQCGAGDGMKLVMEAKRVDFKQAASEVNRIAGGVEVNLKPEKSDAEKQREIKQLWASGKACQRGDDVDLFLRNRGIRLDRFPACLRAGKDGWPMMLAAVTDKDGRGVNVHRTWIKDGEKAPISKPRKVMAGPLPEGCAIRLGPAAERMGIAEGIETALSASGKFGLPVWAAINSSRMKTWTPPPECGEVVIFGDCDPKFGGQAAAFELAHRLAVADYVVSVEIPPHGDWNDPQNRT